MGTIAEESIFVNGWNFWTNMILGRVGGIETQLAFVATFTMVIMFVLIYFLLRYLVIKQLIEKASAGSEEIATGPSAVIAFAFVAILLWSGAIAMIAAVISFTVIIIAFVFIAILGYYLFAISKHAYAGAAGLSTTASKDIQEARGVKFQTRQDRNALRAQEMEYRRKNEALSRMDKAKQYIGRVQAAKKAGLAGLHGLVMELQALYNNPVKAYPILDRAQGIHANLIREEAYEEKAAGYEKSIDKLAGQFNTKTFLKTINDSLVRISHLEKDAKRLDDAEKRSRNPAQAAAATKANAMIMQLDIQKGFLKTHSKTISKLDVDFDKNDSQLYKILNNMKAHEDSYIGPFRAIGADLGNIREALKTGNQKAYRIGVGRALAAITAMQSKDSTFKDLVLMTNVENRLRNDLGKLNTEYKNVENELNQIEKDINQLAADLSVDLKT